MSRPSRASIFTPSAEGLRGTLVLVGHSLMSKYEVMVQDAAARFTDPYKLSSLRRYLESDQVLGRVYEKVKSRLRRTFDRVGDSPTLEEIAQAFDAELLNIYRLADAHVERTIAQYAP